MIWSAQDVPHNSDHFPLTIEKIALLPHSTPTNKSHTTPQRFFYSHVDSQLRHSDSYIFPLHHYNIFVSTIVDASKVAISIKVNTQCLLLHRSYDEIGLVLNLLEPPLIVLKNNLERPNPLLT